MTEPSFHTKQWRSFPPIESLMPIKLANGSEVESLEVTCSDCKVPILQSDCHGEIINDALGIEVRMISKCFLCQKYSFMSGHILMDEKGGWYIAFPPPGTPMKNPWTGFIYPVRQRHD